MRNKFFVLCLVFIGVLALESISAQAVWVDCWSRPNRCFPNIDINACFGDGGQGGTQNVGTDCQYDGSCNFQHELWCDDGYCGDIMRVDCNAGPPPPSEYCGDNICNNGEDCSSCSNDCGPCGPPPPSCGNGNVEAGEECDLGGANGACPSTCSGSCTNNSCGPSEWCGDTICNNGETCGSCAGDCGACAPTSGSISVYFTNANVTSWTIPGAGSGSGNATMTNLPFNTYTISLGPLPGFTCTPDAWSKGINAGSPDATFNVTCTANPALTGTITAIASPRSTVLTSSGQPSGTISGTITGGTGSGYQVQVVVNRGPFANCSYWDGTIWGCVAVPMTNITIVGNTWTATGPRVPPIEQMTSGQTYQVWLNIADSSGAWQYWQISSPIILFETGIPSGTITAMENPATNRLTSNGSPVGTIAGTASDTLSNVTSIQVVIRERNPGGVDGACDAFDRDWNANTGAWVVECTAPAIFLPFTPAQNVNWSYSNTPPTNLMTAGRTYIVYLNIIDAAGNSSVWTPNASVLYSPNSPPTASNVTATEPDYCTVGPSVTVSWIFADPGDPTPQQTAYQVQIDDDPAFGSVNFDSGKIMSSATAYVQSGLGWNVQYYSRARVWDEGDTASAWTNQLFCVGPGCIGGTSWRSPAHPYPTNVNNFSWTPVKPPIGSPVTFNDGPTTCYSAPGVPTPCSTWAWTFGDPLGGTSTLQSPVYTYTTAGSYNVNVTITDGTGLSCTPSVPKVITVQAGLPFIKEVLPK